MKPLRCQIGTGLTTASGRKTDFADIVTSCDITSGRCIPVSVMTIVVPKATFQSDDYWNNKSLEVDGTNGINQYKNIDVGYTQLFVQMYNKTYYHGTEYSNLADTAGYIITEMTSDDEYITITANSPNYLDKYTTINKLYTITTASTTIGGVAYKYFKLYRGFVYNIHSFTSANILASDLTPNTTLSVTIQSVAGSRYPLTIRVKYNSDTDVELIGIGGNTTASGTDQVGGLISFLRTSRSVPVLFSSNISKAYDDYIKMYGDNNTNYAYYKYNQPSQWVSILRLDKSESISTITSVSDNYINNVLSDNYGITTLPTDNKLVGDIFFDGDTLVEDALDCISSLLDKDRYYMAEIGTTMSPYIINNITDAYPSCYSRPSYTISSDNSRILSISKLSTPSSENKATNQTVYAGFYETTFSATPASGKKIVTKELAPIKIKWCYNDTKSDNLSRYIAQCVARNKVFNACKDITSTAFSINEVINRTRPTSNVILNTNPVTIGTPTYDANGIPTNAVIFNTADELGDTLHSESPLYNIIKAKAYDETIHYRTQVYAFVVTTIAGVTEYSCFELSLTGTDTEYVSTYGPYWVPFEVQSVRLYPNDTRASEYDESGHYPVAQEYEWTPPQYVHELIDAENNVTLKDVGIGAVTISYPSGISYYVYTNSKFTDTEQTISDLKSQTSNKTIANTSNIEASNANIYQSVLGNLSSSEYEEDNSTYSGIVTYKNQSSGSYYIEGLNNGVQTFKLSSKESECVIPGLANKVSKTGDSMTGALHLYAGYQASGDTSNPLYLYQKNGTSAQTTYSNIIIRNASYQEIALIGGYQSSTQNGIRLGLKKRDDSGWDSFINFFDDNAGNMSVTGNAIFSRSSVGDIGWSGSANKLIVGSALAYWNGAYSGTSSNLQYCVYGRFSPSAVSGAYITEWGTNGDMGTGYRVWSDGRIEQWGRVKVNSAGQTCYFPFKTYTKSPMVYATGCGSNPYVYVGVANITKTSFTAWTGDDATFNAQDIFFYVSGY